MTPNDSLSGPRAETTTEALKMNEATTDETRAAPAGRDSSELLGALTQWVPLADVLECLALVKDDFVWWTQTPNFDLKYLELRIDMRGQFCVIRDRHHKPVSLEQLRTLTAPNDQAQRREVRASD